MKLVPALLAGSAALNAALLGLMAVRPALAPAAMRDFFGGAATAPTAGARPAERPAAGAAPIWARLQTDDLPALVARLRAAGFAPNIIRAILEAQIDERFHQRMTALVGTVASTPFWKPDPTSGMNNQKFFEEYNQIYRERGKMLRELLGDDYLAGVAADPTAAQRRQFGNLSKAKIEMVQRITDDYSEMAGQVRSAAGGMFLPEDREKLALLDSEKKVDLAAVLSPDELNDYLMRTSTVTNRLRQALSIMDASEAEFRAIYEANAPFTDILYPSGATYFSNDVMQQRRDAQAQIAAQLKTALGDERYADYTRAQNNDYQMLYRLTQLDNLPAEAAARAYDVRNSTMTQSMAIMNDKGLDNDQKHAALQTLAQTGKTQLIGALGVDAGNTYVKSATWLTYIERGGAVAQNPDGGGMSYRSLPSPRN